MTKRHKSVTKRAATLLAVASHRFWYTSVASFEAVVSSFCTCITCLLYAPRFTSKLNKKEVFYIWNKEQ